MTTYKDSGVDINAGNSLVDHIKDFAKDTRRKEVLSGVGGFAGLFSLNHSNVKDPVLVAATDGVGTKLKLALDHNHIENLGQDLVAMCVNDLICCGAEPLFFLDYFATGALDVSQAATVIKSIASCLKEFNCTLLGGETAEMPGLYQGSDFDVAGFAVGIVDKNKIVDGSHVGIGHKIIGLQSSGFHSNGYSLIRKVLQKHGTDLTQPAPGSQKPLLETLLEPTQIYVNPILQLLKRFDISALAHITGGGLVENIPRVLPKNCQATLDASLINTPEIFHWMAEQGDIPQEEMWRVFNMGIGFAVIVKPSDEEAVLDQLKGMKVMAHTIGVIEKLSNPEQRVVLT